MKNINIGIVHIVSFDASCGKMFDYDSYYDKNDECKPEEVVLPAEQEYTLVIDYPTSTPYKAIIKTGEKGMTRIQLADTVCKHYRKMYAEEDETAGGDPVHIPGMLNRNTSKGKYGIWGHDIGDLILCDADVKDNGEIHVGVDS